MNLQQRTKRSLPGAGDTNGLLCLEHGIWKVEPHPLFTASLINQVPVAWGEYLTEYYNDKIRIEILQKSELSS